MCVFANVGSGPKKLPLPRQRRLISLSEDLVAYCVARRVEPRNTSAPLPNVASSSGVRLKDTAGAVGIKPPDKARETSEPQHPHLNSLTKFERVASLQTETLIREINEVRRNELTGFSDDHAVFDRIHSNRPG
jgi:hypothetical protein